MKKRRLIFVLLTVVIVCGLSACGNSNKCNKEGCDEEKFKNELCKKHYQEDVFVGKWYAEYERQEDGWMFDEKKGDKITCTIEVYKGGTGKIYWTDKGEDTSNLSCEWEVDNDCEIMNVSYGFDGSQIKKGYEYNATSNVLIDQSARYIILKKVE